MKVLLDINEGVKSINDYQPKKRHYDYMRKTAKNYEKKIDCNVFVGDEFCLGTEGNEESKEDYINIILKVGSRCFYEEESGEPYLMLNCSAVLHVIESNK